MPEPSCPRKILVVGWDAADWDLIHPLLDGGRMPNLQRIVDGGVIGNIATLQPCLSPLLWTSIATGKTADKHGITGFIEPLPDGQGVRLASSTSRKTKAVWNILSQNGLRSVIVNWYASHPAEPVIGACVSNRFLEAMPPHPAAPWPVMVEAVQPPEWSNDLASLRMHPAELLPVDLAPLVPRIREIDHTQDGRPWKLARAIANCVSIHAVATRLIEREDWDFAAVYYDTIDTVGHDFMAYHPPQMDHVSERDFEFYSGVISELYAFHDQLLGRLLALAGADTTVLLVSDHGFHSGKTRPIIHDDAAAASWHRPYGIFAASGPGILKDERVYGAGLLDITPTILMLFGLPVGLDMDGQALTRILESPPISPAAIPSWDEVSGADGMHPPETREDPFTAAAAVKQLIDLGYLLPVAADAEHAVAIAKCESMFNLACVHLHHARPNRAIPLLKRLLEAHTCEQRYLMAYAQALADLGRFRECRDIVRSCEQVSGFSLQGDALMVNASLAEGAINAASARIAEAGARNSSSPVWHLLIGRAFIAQEMWDSAREAFSSGLDLEEDNPHLHGGMARVLLESREHEQAANHALHAVALLHAYPEAHHILGMAMAGLGEAESAIRAFRAAVAYAPGFADAHLRLAILLEATGEQQTASVQREPSRGCP